MSRGMSWKPWGGASVSREGDQGRRRLRGGQVSSQPARTAGRWTEHLTTRPSPGTLHGQSSNMCLISRSGACPPCHRAATCV